MGLASTAMPKLSIKYTDLKPFSARAGWRRLAAKILVIAITVALASQPETIVGSVDDSMDLTCSGASR